MDPYADLVNATVVVFYTDGFDSKRLNNATVLKAEPQFLVLRLPLGDIVRLNYTAIRKIETIRGVPR